MKDGQLLRELAAAKLACADLELAQRSAPLQPSGIPADETDDLKAMHVRFSHACEDVKKQDYELQSLVAEEEERMAIMGNLMDEYFTEASQGLISTQTRLEKCRRDIEEMDSGGSMLVVQQNVLDLNEKIHAVQAEETQLLSTLEDQRLGTIAVHQELEGIRQSYVDVEALLLQVKEQELGLASVMAQEGALSDEIEALEEENKKYRSDLADTEEEIKSLKAKLICLADSAAC